MSNFLNHLHIEHFKSIQKVDFECRRVNIFIGKPNSGKSNLLEAIALLGLPHQFIFNSNPELPVRFQKLANLFYDENTQENPKIDTSDIAVLINYLAEHDQFFLNVAPSDQIKPITVMHPQPDTVQQYWTSVRLPEMMAPLGPTRPNKPHPVRAYFFKEKTDYTKSFNEYLRPPHGDNLSGILLRLPELRKEIAAIFAELGLEFVISRADGQFEIQKKVDGIVYQYPYTNTADTFQRLIFYLAAIESNSGATLVFEEPEVHAFPPYTNRLAERIVASDENQFFLSTHSPYLLQVLIESLPDTELAVHLVHFKDHATHVHTLSGADVQRVQDLHMDIFFNLDSFLQHEKVGV
jgi:hypothetical protein